MLTSVYNYWHSTHHRCSLCGLNPADDVSGLCHACHDDLPWLDHACPICAEPRAVASNALCPRCSRHLPPFQSTTAALTYRFPVDRLLSSVKYHRRPQLLRWLTACLAERIQQRQQPLPEMLIPVPSHPLTLWRRGFNQAELIASLLASQLSITQKNLLRKRLLTQHQLELDRAQRLKNLTGAFVVDGAPARHIAIVDDVMTTGATVTQAARALRQAGAGEIEVWVIARTAASHHR